MSVSESSLWKLESLMEIGAYSGAALLAMHIPESKFGYLLFLASSVAGLAITWKLKIWSMIRMNLVFSVINLVGVFRWVLM